MTAQALRSFFSLLRSLEGSPPYLLLESSLTWFAKHFPDCEVHPVTSHSHSFQVYRSGVFSELSPEVSKRFAVIRRGLQNRPLLSAVQVKTLSRREERDLSFPGISPDKFWLALPSGPPQEERTWLCLQSPSADPFTGRKLARWTRAARSLHQSLLSARLGEVQEREKNYAAQEESIAFLVHQLKSPLAQIQGGLTEESKKGAGFRRELRQLVSRTQRQVTGYLDLHRARRLKLQWVPLRELAGEIRAYYRTSMNGSLRMNTLFADEGVLVWGNKMYLFDVFQNLIDNALQAMACRNEGGFKADFDGKNGSTGRARGDGSLKADSGGENRGCVHLEATFPEGPPSSDEPHPSDRPQLSKNQFSSAFQKIFLRVRDDGPGIPRWFHPKLFQPFASLKPEGHGLGLCLCQRFVQYMEGSLEYLYTSPENNRGYFQINLTAKEGSNGGKHDV